MKAYGYINYTFINERDNHDISAMFNIVPGDQIIIEQLWTQGEKIRPAFEKLMDEIQPRDILYLSSIDRLGLNTDDAIRLWNTITKEKNAEIVILDNPDLDSRKGSKLTSKKLEAFVRSAYMNFDNRKHLQ